MGLTSTEPFVSEVTPSRISHTDHLGKAEVNTSSMTVGKNTDDLKWQGNTLQGVSFSMLLSLLLDDAQSLKLRIVLLLSHEQWTTTTELIQFFIEKWKKAGTPEKKPVSDSLIVLIQFWISYSPHSFRIQKNFDIFAELAQLVSPFCENNLIEQLQYELDYLEVLSTKPNSLPEPENAPKPITSKSIRPQLLAFDWGGDDKDSTSLTKQELCDTVSVLDFDPQELARQMTLIDHRAISLIGASELQNGAYLKETESPNLNKCSKWFNSLVSWIGTQITTNPNVKERRRLISYFIVLSVKLLALNNFQGLMAIFVGLTQYTVSRMEQTWAGIPQDLKDKWTKVQTLCSPIGNFKHVREKMNAQPIPCVTTTTVFVKDLTFLEEGNKLYVNKNKTLYNIYRLIQAGLTYFHIRQTQRHSFELKPIPFIQYFLLNCKYLTTKEQEIYSLRNDALV